MFLQLYLWTSGDNRKTIEETYNLSKKLNTLGWNTYLAMALPGSPLYKNAIIKGIKVPKKYEEFSFHSYETLPLPTDHLQAHEILELRDKNFFHILKEKEFLVKIEKNLASKQLKISTK